MKSISTLHQEYSGKKEKHVEDYFVFLGQKKKLAFLVVTNKSCPRTSDCYIDLAVLFRCTVELHLVCVGEG